MEPTDALELTIVLERETDGRWIAEVPELPGVLAYGATEAEAVAQVKAIAFVEIGDRLRHGEPLPGGSHVNGVRFHAA
jgi:predicted RNase H-like HicB family nuclease